MKQTIALLFTGILLSAASCDSGQDAMRENEKAISIENNEEVYHSEKPAENGSTDRAESHQSEIWSRYSADDLPDLERRVKASDYTVWLCNYDGLLNQLEAGQTSIELPCNNELVSFELENSSTLSPELAEKFPEIKSMKGTSDNGWAARVDTNTEGLFAEFKQNDQVYVLSPMLKGSKTYYILYNKEDAATEPRDGDFEKK